jgi:hypothetical protein
VLAVLLSLASAVGYGSSDFAAGLAARRASVVRVTLLAGLLLGERPTALALNGIALALPAIRLAGLSLAAAFVALIAAGGAG